MHIRRLISLLMGLWFASVAIVAWSATNAFRATDTFLASPPPELAKPLAQIEPATTRQLTRHIAAEINRGLFEAWGLLEMSLAAAILLLLVFKYDSRIAMLLAALLLLMAIGSHFLLTPQVVAIGRMLDFQDAALQTADRRRFATLHGLYGGLTLFRLLLAGGITTSLLYKGDQTKLRRRRTDKSDAAVTD